MGDETNERNDLNKLSILHSTAVSLSASYFFPGVVLHPHHSVSSAQTVRAELGNAPDVSTIVVVIFSGAVMVIGGRTGCIRPEINTFFTNAVMRLDFPVFSSPQTTILTESAMSFASKPIL